jgi:hypothetical protein
MNEEYPEESSQQSNYEGQEVDIDTDRSGKQPESGNEKRK